MDIDIDTNVVNIIAWTIGSIDLSIGFTALARFYRFVQYENQQVKLAGTHRITRNYSLKKTFHISIMLAMFGTFVLLSTFDSYSTRKFYSRYALDIQRTRLEYSNGRHNLWWSRCLAYLIFLLCTFIFLVRFFRKYF